VFSSQSTPASTKLIKKQPEGSELSQRLRFRNTSCTSCENHRDANRSAQLWERSAELRAHGRSDRLHVVFFILAVDDHYLFTAEELETEVKNHPRGARVTIRYRRYSTIYDTYLGVGSAH
jgi:saccharopine dehydrogenase-like NADP-dependent oxidoreductase